jgi:hypothetical protein
VSIDSSVKWKLKSLAYFSMRAEDQEEWEDRMSLWRHFRTSMLSENSNLVYSVDSTGNTTHNPPTALLPG